MKAIVQDRYGPPEQLRLAETGKPDIGEGQVLVRVRAAAVNPADWAITNGLPYIARPVYGLPKPKTRVRGTDLAGVVEAVGRSVTRFQPGDPVFGWADGSFSEFAVAEEDALVTKPDRLTFEQAAAVPESGQVALQALRDRGHVRPGQRVLVNGASGGIGSLAVQIAKSLGAHVTGVTSTRNMELVRSLGADHVIDYSREDFTNNGERYDVILDNVGNHSLSSLRRALTPSGTLVPNGGRLAENRWFAGGGRVVHARLLAPFVKHALRPFLLSRKRADLETLRDLLEDGTVTPVIDRIYPLGETAQAVRHVGTGRARGKVAIAV
jgi:NADPH:quinone reductase-like Zn-dependent oxidoreductase